MTEPDSSIRTDAARDRRRASPLITRSDNVSRCQAPATPAEALRKQPVSQSRPSDLSTGKSLSNDQRCPQVDVARQPGTQASGRSPAGPATRLRPNARTRVPVIRCSLAPSHNALRAVPRGASPRAKKGGAAHPQHKVDQYLENFTGKPVFPLQSGPENCSFFPTSILCGGGS